MSSKESSDKAVRAAMRRIYASSDGATLRAVLVNALQRPVWAPERRTNAGMQPEVSETLMRNLEGQRALARILLELGGALGETIDSKEEDL